jgi:hypothetical protein
VLEVATRLIADWRTATVKCVDALEIPEDKHGFTTIADTIFELLRLFVDKATEPMMRHHVDKCCKHAVGFRLAMRRMKVPLTIEFPGVAGWSMSMKQCVREGNTEVPVGHSLALESALPHETDDIECTLFGALVRPPVVEGVERQVLVKAAVTVRRQKEPVGTAEPEG